MKLQHYLQQAAIKIYNEIDNDTLLRSDSGANVNKKNKSGDTVKPLDIIANDIFIEEFKKSEEVYSLASEENANIITINKKGNYSVTLDPLDGSQNIDVTLSIGSIFSVYSSKIGEMTDYQQTGKKLIAAGYVLYSQSLLFVWATKDGVDIFAYSPSLKRFIKIQEKYTMPKKGRIYSINEAKSIRWNKPELYDYICDLKKYQYTMRFTGCMVADVHRILMKGGIFCYPADEMMPEGLLRLLYEAIPMAYVIEKAGGIAIDGIVNLTNIKPSKLHNRIPVYMGSSHEMTQLKSYFKLLYKEKDS